MIPEDTLNDEAKNELNKFKTKIEKTVDRESLIYRESEYKYIFENFQTIKTFGRDINNGKITLKEVDEDQSNLLVEIINFKNKPKPQDPKKKYEKENEFFDGRKRVLDAFESKIFLIKARFRFFKFSIIINLKY